MANVVINQVNLAGNLTRDPEIRALNSGSSVARVSIAVNNRIKKGDEWVDDPMFIDVTVFGKQADWVSENLDKGNAVFVSGRLQFRSWEDKEGNKRSKHEVIAEKITLLTPKNSGGSGREPGSDDDDYSQSHAGRKVDLPGQNREVPF